jgi:hypothetical protein
LVRTVLPVLPLLAATLLPAGAASPAANYQSFHVAVYARAYEVRQMKDLAWLEARWATITSGLKKEEIEPQMNTDKHG